MSYSGRLEGNDIGKRLLDDNEINLKVETYVGFWSSFIS